MSNIINTRIVLRNDSLENWQNSTLSLLQGEIALGKRDNGSYDLRVGSGDKTWNDLSSSLAISAEQVIGLTEYLNSSFDEKLDKEEFKTLSNSIGLSAAIKDGGVIDPIATQGYVTEAVKDLAGAMHFEGIKTTVPPTDGETYESGDIIILSGTSKEYVYDGSKWHELGDEGIYATKTELNNESTARTAADSYLSTAIDNKIYVDGLSAKSLYVTHIDQDAYHQLVEDEKLSENTIYVVSADNLNMYDERIVNLADGIDSNDAINVKQLRTISAEIMTEVSMVAPTLINSISEINGGSANT